MGWEEPCSTRVSCPRLRPSLWWLVLGARTLAAPASLQFSGCCGVFFFVGCVSR